MFYSRLALKLAKQRIKQTPDFTIVVPSTDGGYSAVFPTYALEPVHSLTSLTVSRLAHSPTALLSSPINDRHSNKRGVSAVHADNIKLLSIAVIVTRQRSSTDCPQSQASEPQTSRKCCNSCAPCNGDGGLAMECRGIGNACETSMALSR
jgi:hypothetical protein